MRVLIRLILFLFAYAFSCGAGANNLPCEALHDLKKPNPKLCVCRDYLSKLPITIPAGFSLTAACNYQPYVGDVLGTYTFKGNVILSGLITSSVEYHEIEGEMGSYLNGTKLSHFSKGTS